MIDTYLPYTYLFVSCLLLFPWSVFTIFGWIWTLLDGRPDELLFCPYLPFPVFPTFIYYSIISITPYFQEDEHQYFCMFCIDGME